MIEKGYRDQEERFDFDVLITRCLNLFIFLSSVNAGEEEVEDKSHLECMHNKQQHNPLPYLLVRAIGKTILQAIQYLQNGA